MTRFLVIITAVLALLITICGCGGQQQTAQRVATVSKAANAPVTPQHEKGRLTASQWQALALRDARTINSFHRFNDNDCLTQSSAPRSCLLSHLVARQQQIHRTYNHIAALYKNKQLQPKCRFSLQHLLTALKAYNNGQVELYNGIFKHYSKPTAGKGIRHMETARTDIITLAFHQMTTCQPTGGLPMEALLAKLGTSVELPPAFGEGITTPTEPTEPPSTDPPTEVDDAPPTNHA